MLTASQSVAGVLRQVGIVLAVAIFVTGLYSNISVAKNSSIDYAKAQISSLNLPQNSTAVMEKQAVRQIQEESSTTSKRNHFSSQEKEAMIQKRYEQALIQNRAVEASSEVQEEIFQKVTRIVTSELEKMNQKINRSISNIEKFTKQRMSNAFISLYKASIIFVGGSALTALLFDKKSKKRKK
ncbi:hypothetical protein [Lactococcus lactis]|nr:hypothetical protein [Lactococcus lactis]